MSAGTLFTQPAHSTRRMHTAIYTPDVTYSYVRYDTRKILNLVYCSMRGACMHAIASSYARGAP